MLRLHSFLILTVAARGGSSPPPAEKPAPQTATHTADDLVPMCKRIFARKETCADDYLPVLLDLRVELNKPPGIGDEVKAKGRDAVLAIARTELASDTQPDKVAATCGGAAAQMAKAPPERASQLLGQGVKCEAAADCKAFSMCVVEIDRGFIAASSHQPACASILPERDQRSRCNFAQHRAVFVVGAVRTAETLAGDLGHQIVGGGVGSKLLDWREAATARLFVLVDEFGRFLGVWEPAAGAPICAVTARLRASVDSHEA